MELVYEGVNSNSNSTLTTKPPCLSFVVFFPQTQLSKLLQLKQQRLSKLNQYNTDVEKMVSNPEKVGDFC